MQSHYQQQKHQRLLHHGEEFTIVLKFDDNIKMMQARIEYDSDLVVMSDENENSYISINPTYSTGVLALYYSPMSNSISETSFYIKATALDVTQATVANFTIKNLEVTNLENTTEDPENATVSITINPKSSETQSSSSVASSTTSNDSTSSASSTSNDETTATSNSGTSTNDNTVTSTEKLAQTGENNTVLFIIGGLIIMGIIGIVKFKNLKRILLEILPVFIFGIILMSGNKVEAETITVESGKFDPVEVTVYDEDGETELYKVTAILKTGVNIGNEEKSIITLNVNGEYDVAENYLTYNVLERMIVELQCNLQTLYDTKAYTLDYIYLSEPTDGTTYTSDTQLKTGDCIGLTILNESVDTYVVIYGDGNCDGKIAGNDDLQIIIDDYLHGTYKDTLQEYAMDVFCDGKLNVFDMYRLIQLTIGNLGEDDSLKTPDSNDDDNKGYTGGNYEAYSILFGDADCDGDVDVADEIAIMSYISNSQLYPLTAQGINNADVYQRGDGLSNMDAEAILKYLNGSIVSLPESWFVSE